MDINKELNCWEKFLDSFVKILKRSVKTGDFCIEVLVRQNLEDGKQKVNELLTEWRKKFPENPADVTALPINVFVDLIASTARNPERIVGVEIRLATLFIFCLQFNFRPEMNYMGNFKKILMSAEMKSGLKNPKNSQFYKRFIGQLEEAKKEDEQVYSKANRELISALCLKYR